MEADWAENQNTWLTQALITQCIDHTLDYVKFEEEAHGTFYAGLDLGKHQDPSVLAIFRVENQQLRLVHLRRFPLETPYASVIGYVKTISDRWQSIIKILVDQSGVGDYITEDMTNTGIDNIEGVTFTQERKQEMAQHLKQTITEKRLFIPYDSELIAELNLEQYELSKDGKIRLSHPLGTHDDRFWALGLAAYASRTQPSPRLWVISKALKNSSLQALRQRLVHRRGGKTQ
jgi:phage FluMu gp28-like protein